MRNNSLLYPSLGFCLVQLSFAITKKLSMAAFNCLYWHRKTDLYREETNRNLSKFSGRIFCGRFPCMIYTFYLRPEESTI